MTETKPYKVAAVLICDYDETLKETLKEAKIKPRATSLYYIQTHTLLKLNPREADWYKPYKGTNSIRARIEKDKDNWHLGLWLFDSEAEAQERSKELYDKDRVLAYILDVPTKDDWDFLKMFKTV